MECGRKLWGLERESRSGPRPSTSGVLRIERPVGPSDEDLYDDAILFGFRTYRGAGGFMYPGSLPVLHLAILPMETVDLILSSQSLRFAILSVAWFLEVPNRVTQSMKALDRCYPLFRKSLSQPPNIQTFYTCLALFRVHYLLKNFDGALIHLSGMVRIVRALKAQNVSITDAEWNRMESRLMNSVSITEQMTFVLYHNIREEPAHVLAERVHRIIQVVSLNIDMVKALGIPYSGRDLENRLTILSLHINFLFVRYLEPGCRRNGRDQPISIASKLRPLLHEFGQLLLCYDPRVSTFVNFATDPQLADDWLGSMHDPNLIVHAHRVESYCLASFLQHILINDTVDRNDSEIHSLGLVCFRAIELQVKHSFLLSHCMFSFVLASILLPTSKFPDRIPPICELSDGRMCADEGMV